MSKNVGFTKKEAEELAKDFNENQATIEAYAQKEEHFKSMMGNGDVSSYQWIVVLQKRRANDQTR